MKNRDIRLCVGVVWVAGRQAGGWADNLFDVYEYDAGVSTSLQISLPNVRVIRVVEIVYVR
jgi:hypothetical protein